jgi:transcriptional regulator with XRE-family HTH domain
MYSPAELIRTARTSRGLTQRALAARAGVAQSTIARFENGDADPTWTTVNRLLESAAFHLAEPIPTVPTLAEAATDGSDLDWTMIRAVTDRAERSPADTALMIGAEPLDANATTAVILAAIGAYLAEQHHLRVPTLGPPHPTPRSAVVPPWYPTHGRARPPKDAARRRPVQRLAPP